MYSGQVFFSRNMYINFKQWDGKLRNGYFSGTVHPFPNYYMQYRPKFRTKLDFFSFQIKSIILTSSFKKCKDIVVLKFLKLMYQ